MKYKSFFTPECFIELFYKELLPSFYAMEICAKVIGDGDLQSFPPLLNPFHLGYVTSYDYKNFCFATNGPSIDDYIFIFDDMSEEDIREEVFSAISKHKEYGTLFKCRIGGFDSDKREIWEIPEVIKLAFNFSQYGGCGILIPTGNIELAKEFYLSEDELNIAKIMPPLGAFEIWSLANQINLNGISNDEWVAMYTTGFLPYIKEVIKLIQEL